MISFTHTLFALAVLTKKERPLRNRSAFWGSVIPDAFIYVAALAWMILSTDPMPRFWNEIYFEQPMQAIASAFNSIPIYMSLLVLGYCFRKSKMGLIVLFFALAALLHISMDFPVHAHDAYAHFWPFSDWKFHSPFSYYETHLHAKWVGLIELLIVCGSAWVLHKRFHKTWITITLTIICTLYWMMVAGQWYRFFF